MSTVSIAFVVYQPVNLTFDTARPLDLTELDAALVRTSSTALAQGKTTHHLSPGVFIVRVTNFDHDRPSLEFSFDRAGPGVALAIPKSDDDPWPVPPPPPPPTAKVLKLGPGDWVKLWTSMR